MYNSGKSRQEVLCCMWSVTDWLFLEKLKQSVFFRVWSLFRANAKHKIMRFHQVETQHQLCRYEQHIIIELSWKACKPQQHKTAPLTTHNVLRQHQDWCCAHAGKRWNHDFTICHILPFWQWSKTFSVNSKCDLSSRFPNAKFPNASEYSGGWGVWGGWIPSYCSQSLHRRWRQEPSERKEARSCSRQT